MSEAPDPTALSVALSESQRAWIDEQSTANGYGTASDYVRALISAEQQRRAQARLEELLLEGINSGPGQVVTPEYWEKLTARAVERFEQRRET